MTETEKHIEHLEMAGNNLLQQAANLRNGFKPSNKCKHATEKNCLKCGGKKIIECSNSKVKLKTVSQGYCKKCEHLKKHELSTNVTN